MCIHLPFLCIWGQCEIVLLVIIEGMMANVDGMFNLTATYEDDADIWLPYGFYSKRSKPLDDYLPAQKNR